MQSEWRKEIEDTAFHSKKPGELLSWALERFQSRVALSAAFGAECVVLIDMLAKLTPAPRIFSLDTGRLPQETYALMDRIRHKYNVKLEIYFPEAQAVEEMVREKGVNLFLDSVPDRQRCCGVRKVAPLKRALSGLDAWITGLRRDQALTRAQIRKAEIDTDHGGIAKINPLADWTNEQVWEYIKANRVPYNKLHDQNYPSIGCACCTRAVQPGEDIRAGRWWWENPEHKECGLHVRR